MTLYNSFIEELPLILFTVIAQSAVGFSLLYAFNNGSTASEDRSYKKFGMIFIVLVALGMITSTFHLGDPFHAPYMITRVFGFTQNDSFVISWLPLEIVGIALMLLLGVAILLKGNKNLIYILPVVGLAMLYAMGNIYGSMANTIPTWNLNLTLLLFFSSALLLGSIAYTAFIASESKEYKYSVIAAVIGFVLFVLALVLYTFHLGNLNLDIVGNAFELADGKYELLLGWGIILCGLSLILLLIEEDNTKFAKIAFVVSFIGVFLTRIVFYGLITSHIFIG
ncbi:hypothetical protein CRV08_12620 [Halarcobacter ebronensis]|uniref:Dimethyl sulfoxide reductase n=1 Tax=Halarcobacter ebronensis TaxID=1462615 RepID=A0A4Q0Y9J4_9BACT|nr:DmsC/YnfH family molybdoenzyme membrane anchor subunit [Halarcobacter ebronensis]RXJ66663.1 hypothetical protein CRV08_12620 [Halarcobacter ebronensis]